MNKFLVVLAAVTITVARADSGYQRESYKNNNPSSYTQNDYAGSRRGESYDSYAAQPYEFGYRVSDGYNADFGQMESSNGRGLVVGSYRVKLSDGRNQIVNYKDEGNGFEADVTYEGIAQYPENKMTGYPSQKYGDDPYSSPIYRTKSSNNPGSAYQGAASSKY